MQTNIQQDLKSIRIVYSALIIAVVVFLGSSIFLAYLNNGTPYIDDELISQVFQTMIFVFGVPSFAGGMYIFNKKIKAITVKETNEKLAKYREAMIIRAATIEGASFFFVSGHYMFNDDVFIIAALIGLGFLAFFFPTNARIAKELNIQEQELNQ